MPKSKQTNPPAPTRRTVTVDIAVVDDGKITDPGNPIDLYPHQIAQLEGHGQVVTPVPPPPDSPPAPKPSAA